jgi:cell division protease FtsH
VAGGGTLSTGKNFSEETARRIDEEIRQILTDRLNGVTDLLREKLPLLKKVGSELLEKEALNDEEFQALLG